ncbi:DNA-binding transcriptional regulator [Pseudomonas syringae pv. actinidiae]|uniref:DNA-binding transcriptional regulator n=1 Tax=Pseudomonas syringae pv. actinidiae TaxID=103796 RepID=A0AAN4PZW5_PSESF|nr:DNA-binding transcriptional regulator [Pseudomonas syringae pv. actinidiae]
MRWIVTGLGVLCAAGWSFAEELLKNRCHCVWPVGSCARWGRGLLSESHECVSGWSRRFHRCFKKCPDPLDSGIFLWAGSYCVAFALELWAFWPI